jgi:hypothetical protein
MMALFVQSHNFIRHGKDLELFVLFPQPSVKFLGAVKARVVVLLNIPYGDFAVKCVEVEVVTGILMKSNSDTLAHGNKM